MAGLSPQSVKTYLASVKFMHTYLGHEDLAAPHSLKMVQRGIARQYSNSPHKSRIRLPLTPTLLGQIRSAWETKQFDVDIIMLWAALCTGFFGFLRLGEMTSPTQSRFNPSTTLCFEDLSVDDQANPQMVMLLIKQSKTDQLRTGFTVSLARSDGPLCPVAALLAYIAVRGDRAGPLFIHKDGRFLTHQALVTNLRAAIQEVGVDPLLYAGHSLRIGAATTAAAVGLQDSQIKALGRWKSNAFEIYIRRPCNELASLASRLAE